MVKRTQLREYGLMASVGAAAYALAVAAAPQPVPPVAPPLLTFRAKVHVTGSPHRVQPLLVIHNRGGELARIAYDDCSASLRAYRTPDRTGTPAWDQDRWPGPRSGTSSRAPCAFTGGARLNVAPGDSVKTRDFRLVPTVEAVLGDSLPPGPYHFTAQFRYRGTGMVIDSVRVSAGSAVLVR